VSNIDQWLNSAAAAGAWYSARHSYDAPPNSANVWTNYNEYDAEAGFLSNFEESFRNAILDTTIRVAKNTVTDGGGYEDITRKVYLLSKTEVGLSNENGIAEGSKWDLFSNNNSREAYPTAEAVSRSEYTSPLLYASAPWIWRLRTPYADRSGHAWYVELGGTPYSNCAYYGSGGVRPALELDSGILVSDSPDTDGAYIIQWGDDTVTGEGSFNDSLTPDGWHYFAIRWNAQAGTADLFHNGVKRVSLTYVAFPAEYDRIEVGHRSGDPGDWLNSLIGDLRISNRARTDAEIAAAYQSGQPAEWDEWTTLKLIFSYSYFEWRNEFQSIYFLLSHIEYKPDLFVEEYEIKLEVIGLAISGSTITLKATFPDSAGDLQELENVVVKIYAPGKVLLKTIPATKISTGVYTADYTIPEDKEGQFDYEFSGSLESRTIVGRSSFDSHWR